MQTFLAEDGVKIDAIASAESVRIAPSLRSQKGAIWTKSKTTFDWWDVEIVFRVSGRGRVGADGLAFWYTTEKGDYNGDVFGSSDRWSGLGLFFDSFDNDNKHNNPYIMAVLNDGTKKFDHQNDGTTQLLSGCLRDFRNKPFPTRARIEYYNNVLTVLFHNGMTNNNEDYEMCLRAEGVQLPKAGYFGLSAATGGLADDHDVFHFLTTSLHPAGQDPQQPSDEADRLSKEYLEYQKKLEQQKEDYRREHPDKAPKEELDDWFESDNQRELRQIWQAQSGMTEVIRDLSRKMDEVIGRQERTLGLLSVGGGGAPHQGTGAPAQGGAMQPAAVISRHEVEALLQNNNYIAQTSKEIRQIIGDLAMRTDTILQNQARQPTAQVQASGYETQGLLNEMRESMNNVKQGLAQIGHTLSTKDGGGAGCPTSNCLGLTTFLVITVIQLSLVFCYSLFRDSREAKAKKFY
ncbi:protein ERGIC-53 isoform X3 [Lutzomyia longipalpis]|uniref:protein ERGIC-53 isoform X3 n=1 Tax=Lutzomyia longipalpis TaxID=7200 RepID=UPI002484031F|nr:protein ERGIC-53 isoform X3 [Lutzomyia longipalpis]